MSYSKSHGLGKDKQGRDEEDKDIIAIQNFVHLFLHFAFGLVRTLKTIKNCYLYFKDHKKHNERFITGDHIC